MPVLQSFVISHSSPKLAVEKSLMQGVPFSAVSQADICSFTVRPTYRLVFRWQRRCILDSRLPASTLLRTSSSTFSFPSPNTQQPWEPESPSTPLISIITSQNTPHPGELLCPSYLWTSSKLPRLIISLWEVVPLGWSLLRGE
jgi:hypothetical protein